MKRLTYILVPDSLTTGLYCKGSWLPISADGRIGAEKGKGYPMSAENKRNLLKHTRLAIKQAEKTVRDLSMGLERLRMAETKEW